MNARLGLGLGWGIGLRLSHLGYSVVEYGIITALNHLISSANNYIESNYRNKYCNCVDKKTNF